MKTHLARPPCAWCLDPLEAHEPNCTRCECRRYVGSGFGALVAAEARSWANRVGQELERAGRWVWRVLGEVGQGLINAWSLIRSTVERMIR